MTSLEEKGFPFGHAYTVSPDEKSTKKFLFKGGMCQNTYSFVIMLYLPECYDHMAATASFDSSMEYSKSFRVCTLVI